MKMSGTEWMFGVEWGSLWFWAYVFIIAALLTIVVETVFWACIGYRRWNFVVVCVLVNLATNLGLNATLWLLHDCSLLDIWSNWLFPLFILELAVVVIEFLVFRALLRAEGTPAREWPLFLKTAVANALTFVSGFFLLNN